MWTRSSSAWTLGGSTVGQLARRVWSELWADEVPDRAAVLAYYFLFALFPALLFLTALLAFLPVPNLMDTLMRYVERILPATAAGRLEQTVAEVTQQRRGGLLSLGAVLALWSASAGMASVMNALNVAYDLDDVRAWWKRRAVAIVLTVGFALFIIGGLVLLVFGPKLANWAMGLAGLASLPELAWTIMTIPVALFFVTLGVALVYYLAPAGQQRWRWITPGSALAVGLWLLMSIGLRVYTASFGSYNATYGSIGAVILLMLWLYLTGFALLVGAEVDAEIEAAAARHGIRVDGVRAPRTT